MGYEVHITRKAAWFEDDGPIISLKEWLEYVSSDSEMRADGYAEAQTPDVVLRVDDPGMYGPLTPATVLAEAWRGFVTSGTA